MNYYCLGFAFKETFRGLRVVLIKKTKPEWQRGKINGVGGKIESGECCNVAMAREFEEETGCKTFATDWKWFTVMRFIDGTEVHCFAAKLASHQDVTTTTEEEISLVDLRDIHRDSRAIPNLLWLIPMARYALESPNSEDEIPHVLQHV